MPTEYTYLIIDVLTIAIPFAFSFHAKIRFNHEWKYYFPANLLIALLFVIWDAYYTHLGVWGFNPNYCTGLKIIGLPIEEILFFICIPYSSIFTYHCIKSYFKNIRSLKQTTVATLLFIVSLIIGIASLRSLYTGVTLIAASLLSLYVIHNKTTTWKWHFFLAYLIILLPFFIVNGILTGSMINEPIVWYNNSHNLNIRMGTIPVEDLFYGLLLLLLNTVLYEFFKQRSEKKNIGLPV